MSMISAIFVELCAISQKLVQDRLNTVYVVAKLSQRQQAQDANEIFLFRFLSGLAIIHWQVVILTVARRIAINMMFVTVCRIFTIEVERTSPHRGQLFNECSSVDIA
jgi:hypothetical protein